MLALPMACLLVATMGQAGSYNSDKDPEALIQKASQAVTKGNLDEYADLIIAIRAAISTTRDPNQKCRLENAYLELKINQKNLSEKTKVISGLKNKTDKDVAVALFVITIEKNLHRGKEAFLSTRGEIERLLQGLNQENPVDRTISFTFRKMLADMERLTQLDQDPVNQAKTEKLFTFLASEITEEKSAPVDTGETDAVKNLRQMQLEASRLFGPTSFLRFRLVIEILKALAVECRTGQMPDLDLQVEMDRELSPFLNSDWANNWSFKLIHTQIMANICLSKKGKNFEKLARLIKELEALRSGSEPDSHVFLETIAYRLMMLTQQGHHQECLEEFKKISIKQLYNSPLAYLLHRIEIHLCAAQSYEAIGKNDLALLQQEAAFGLCMELGSVHHTFLSRFKKNIAKDLRDKYAKNNKWKEARNLEERCQLLGLAFDPLPKQPFE